MLFGISYIIPDQLSSIIFRLVACRLMLVTEPRSIAQRQLQCTLRPRAQWIRDQLLSCAGGPFSLQPYRTITHSNRDLNYSGLNPTATTLIPDPCSSQRGCMCLTPLITWIRDQFSSLKIPKEE